MIEGVLRHCTDMEIQRQYVDSHGQSAVGFAFCHLIGFELAPRLKAIARQKFQSTSAATPPVGSASSGGSGGVGDRDFNFNLVGNTQTNQLAEAIQGQFSQPLKAFVVSKDVTTQQELDANIKGTATF